MLEQLLLLENQPLVRSVALLMAATMASGTALLVGFVVYGRQKRIDRENDTLTERRLLYRDYITCSQELLRDLNKESEDGPSSALGGSWRRYVGVLNAVQIIAPDKVLYALEEHEKTLMRYHTTFFSVDESIFLDAVDTEATAREALLNTMRADNFAGTQFHRIALRAIKLNEKVC